MVGRANIRREFVEGVELWKCSHCKISKPKSAYSNSSEEKMHAYCIPCVSARAKERFTNPSERIAALIRASTRMLVYRKKSREGTAEKWVGCSREEFVEHLIKTLKVKPPNGRPLHRHLDLNPELAIDHIIPLSALDLTDPDIRFLSSHYSNIQLGRRAPVGKYKSALPQDVQEALQNGMTLKDCLEHQKENPGCFGWNA